MVDRGSVTDWIERAKQGDEDAVSRLFDRYFAALVTQARRQLGDFPRQAADEYDVAQSAFKSFCLAAANGKFPDLNSRDSLWRLLMSIIAHKVISLKRHALRRKRRGGTVRGQTDLQTSELSHDGIGLAAIIDKQQTPEMEALIAENFDRLINMLGDERDRRVAIDKLHGYTNQEIADRIGWSLRTVERSLQLTRKKWKKEMSP